MHVRRTSCNLSLNAEKRFHTVPPKFRTEPTDQEVLVGSSIMVSCVADGFPVPKVEWKQLLEDGSEYRDMRENFSNFIIMNNGSFLIENVTKKNEGKFLCQVTNGIGGEIRREEKM